MSESKSTQLYVAYFEYGATGEGTTLIVAVAASETVAKRVFNTRCAPFFAGNAVTSELEDVDFLVRKAIPEFVVNTLTKAPAGSWFCEFHCNFS